MLLLASRALFISLIAVVVVVVLLCLGLSAFLFYKSAHVKKSIEADVIRKELYRRETEVVVKIFHEKPDESKREALINELRRIKSAELLVEEIIKAEKAERSLAENRTAKPAKSEKPAKPAKSGNSSAAPKEGVAPAQESGKPAPAAAAEQPASGGVQTVESGSQYKINADKGNPPSGK